MPVDISLISPVFNEENNIAPLYEAIAQVIPSPYTWELILIDDGSTDRSRTVIRELCGSRKNIRAVFLSKNYGQQVALTAGYDCAYGRAVVTLDADLQHPPQSVPAMIKLWEEGNDIVFAVRDDDHKAAWFKRMSSRWFYSFLKTISNADLVQGAADFRLLDQKVVYYLRLYRERDRFLRGIISDMGFRRAIHLYKESTRKDGVTKYSLGRMVGLGIAGVFAFSSFPLRICSIIGMVVAALSLVYAGMMVYEKLVSGAPVGIASILVGVFFIGGVQLFFIGILGEYLMSVFREVKARPLYCISEMINE